MEEQNMGLAGQGLQEQALPQRNQMEEMVQKVAQLLQQGATPEELLQMGVDRSIIDMAMQLIESQQGSVAGPTQNAGLAGSQM